MNIVFPSERIAMMNMHATLHLVHAIRQASALHCIHHCEIPFVRQQNKREKLNRQNEQNWMEFSGDQKNM